MRAFILGTTAFAIACSSPAPPAAENPEAAPARAEPREPAVEVGEYAKVYRGDEGLRITIVPVDSDEGDQALIGVAGVSNELDGLVLLYEKVSRGRDRWSYRTTLNGEDFNAVWKRNRREGEGIEVYLPGDGRSSRRATFDEEASEAAEPREFADRYAELVRGGTIAQLQAFNREERERRHDKEFGESLSRRLEACDADVDHGIDWATVSDEELKEYSISGYCEHIGTGVAWLCRYPQSKRAFRERVSEIRCELGDESSVDLSEEGRLTWVAGLEGVNLHDVARDLTRAEFGRDRVVLRSESGLSLIIDPGDPDVPIHYSGDGETFYEHAETARSGSGSRRWLFARYENAELDFDEGTWSLSCGPREAVLRELPAEDAKAAIEGAELRDHKWKREPFALARDDRGRYFYVDRLRERYGGKGFRVFMGFKGGLERTRLVDVADDSKGTVYATDDGRLRLIIDKEGAAGGAAWIRGEERTELVVLPLDENHELLYRELGVYTGESLGSACEEL